MKIYVASRFAQKKKVQEIYRFFQKNGYAITTDWTNHVESSSYSKNEERSTQYAIEDINGVIECDVFILLSSEKAGSGSSTELGAAIARNTLVKIPHIFVLGGYKDANLFYFHPSVSHVDSMEEILDYLQRAT